MPCSNTRPQRVNIQGFFFFTENGLRYVAQNLFDNSKSPLPLTNCGWVTHICVSKLTIIGSNNGLLPDQRKAIIWTSAGILLIRPLGTNFNEILIEIYTFSFKKIHLKVLSGKWRPFCFCLNVLNYCGLVMPHGIKHLGHLGSAIGLLHRILLTIYASLPLIHCALVKPYGITDFACLAQRHYLNQCWLIANWTLRN